MCMTGLRFIRREDDEIVAYTINTKIIVDIDDNRDRVFNKYVVATVDFSLDVTHKTYNNDEFEKAFKDAISMWDKLGHSVEGALIESTYKD